MCARERIKIIEMIPYGINILEILYFVNNASNCITAFTQVCRKRRLKVGFTVYINVAVLCRNSTHKFVQLY